MIADASGAPAEQRDAYDAWGKRRFANGTDDVTGSITSQTPRGFTGEEMLASVGLLHLPLACTDAIITAAEVRTCDGSRRNHRIAAAIDGTTSAHGRLARMMKYTSRRDSEAPPRILHGVRGNLFVAFADLMRRCRRKENCGCRSRYHRHARRSCTDCIG